MKNTSVKNGTNQRKGSLKRALQLAIIIMATSCGFILRVGFLEKSK